MADNMPRTLPDLINWCSTHTSLWTANAEQVGLTDEQATAFKSLCDAMTANYAAAQAARQASKDATMNLQNAVTGVRALGGAYIAIIKGFAESSGDMDVYALAGVSPSNPPGTVPAPVPPTQFGATVNPDGSLTIKWRVSQPEGVSGVQYLVSRRVNGGNGPFTFVGAEASNKSFTDLTLPVGVDKVEYIVQPKRLGVVGEQSNVFAVQFGSVAGGGGLSISTIASTPHAEPMKLAA